MASCDSQRGAVNILFPIVVLVFALIFGALWFFQMQKAEEADKNAKFARSAKEAAEARANWYRDYYAAVARFVGGGIPPEVPWTEAAANIPASDEAAKSTKRLEEALKGIGQRVDDQAANPATLVDALEVPVAKYLAAKLDIGAKTQEIARLQKESETKESTIQANARAYQEEKTRIQNETDATMSRLNTQMNEVRAQNEDVQNKIREANTELEKVRTETNTERQKLVTQTKELEGQVRQVHGELRIKRATETPDGKILSADAGAGLAMIDISSQNMLRRGTRFKVYETGKGGVKIHKGWITVTDIGPTMSEARIDETVAGAGLIGSGDWLYNPYFEKAGSTSFVFLGQLPGRYNREMAEKILTGFGAKVEPKVTVKTSFLVLGEKDDPDAEELTESPEYKNAMTWGVEVIRARDLAPFLQM